MIKQFYKDANNEWRWKLHTSGNNTANSGEGYKRRIDAVTVLDHILKESALQLVRNDLAAALLLLNEGELSKRHTCKATYQLIAYINGAILTIDKAYVPMAKKEIGKKAKA